MHGNEEQSDEEVVKAVRRGNPDLYAVIINRYQNKLLRYASSLVKDGDKAADIVQESFIKTFINLQGFDADKKFSSWIYRIVHNEAMNCVKKYGKESPLAEEADFESEEDVEEDFDKKEVGLMVERCLGEIPIKYSEPLSLYFIEEKSYKEISDILRMPMGTVSVRINRAKALMKKICKENQIK